MTTVLPLFLCSRHMTMRMSRKFIQPEPGVPGIGRNQVRAVRQDGETCLSEYHPHPLTEWKECQCHEKTLGTRCVHTRLYSLRLC